MLCLTLALAVALAGPGAPLPGSVGAPAPAVAQPLGDEALDGARGGESAPSVTVSSQMLTGLSSGNSVSAGSVVTGAVNLGQGAFSGFNGLGNFVVNTGNNNVLQGALGVSISMPASR